MGGVAGVFPPLVGSGKFGSELQMTGSGDVGFREESHRKLVAPDRFSRCISRYR